MKNVAVVGSQWGDEGKGKIVDWLSSKAELVVRFQGGNNAGHTIKVDKNIYKLTLLPSRRLKRAIAAEKRRARKKMNKTSMGGSRRKRRKSRKKQQKKHKKGKKNKKTRRRRRTRRK